MSHNSLTDRDVRRHASSGWGRSPVIYARCAAADIDELTTLATTVEVWWPPIKAFVDTGITNARAEGINRLVRQVKRSACGFDNPTNGHRRIRFHCTGNTGRQQRHQGNCPHKVDEPIAEPVRRYALRYRTLRENPRRVAPLMQVDSIIGRAKL